MKFKLRRITLVCASALAFGACMQPADGNLTAGEVGEVNQAITNGMEVTPAEYEKLQFMVGISHKDGGTRSGHQCGGTLIHPGWVLTAAHCFQEGRKMHECITDPSKCRGLIGSRRTGEINANANLFQIAKVYVHPNHSRASQENDIALVRLTVDAPFKPVALFSDAHADMTCQGFSWPGVSRPCGLWSSNDIPATNPPFIQAQAGADWTGEWLRGKPLLAVGWGATKANSGAITDYLLRTGMGPNEAAGTLAFLGYGEEGWRNGTDLPPDRVTDSMIAAGDPYLLSDTCFGDSGGPLLVRSGGEWQQVGITSHGFDGDCMSGSMYTYVPDYFDWIDSYIGITKVSGPGLTDDAWAMRTNWAPGTTGAQPNIEAHTSHWLAGGFSPSTTNSTGTFVLESESVIAFDLAQVAGGSAALDKLNVKYAKLKVFVHDTTALAGPLDASPAGELCLHPNTTSWSRTAGMGWNARPSAGACISKGQFASTNRYFMQDYAGYTRLKGDDLGTYVTFHIPADSASNWMRNGFTIRGLANNGFQRILSSSESPYPPELTVVYDCKSPLRDAGSMRCVSGTAARVMRPVLSAASMANDTPVAGTLRVGGSSSNPERALVKFDVGAIAAEMGTGTITSATLEVPVASTSGWSTQYVGLFRADADWNDGPVPLALTPGASTSVGAASGGVMRFDVKNDLNLLINGLSLWPAPGVQRFNNYGWAVRKIAEWYPGTLTVGTINNSPAKLTVVVTP